MGGFFGVTSRRNCILDVFFGTDYHSHLGTRNAGMAIWSGEEGFRRQIHSIANTPFRTRFEKDLADCEGCDELRFLAYQVQLMMNRTPTRTGSTDYNYLVDKTDQHIDFLTQFASSVRYCTEELNALHGKKGTLIGDVEYYEEMPDMPKPDKVIHDIHLLSDGTASGEKKYILC